MNNYMAAAIFTLALSLVITFIVADDRDFLYGIYLAGVSGVFCLLSLNSIMEQKAA